MTPNEIEGAVLVSPDPHLLERFGDFLLAQDPDLVVRANETQATRADYEWPHGQSPWDAPGEPIELSSDRAKGDPRVPLLTAIPQGHEFFGSRVLGDTRGPVRAYAGYIRPELRTVKLPLGRSRAATLDDATITITWSLLDGKPLYVVPVRTPGGPSALGVAVMLDETYKLTLKRVPAILRLYSTRGRGDTYGYRVPSVALNWYEGDVAWSFHSHFLTPPDAIAAARSIRGATFGRRP